MQQSFFQFFLQSGIIAGVISASQQRCRIHPFTLRFDDLDFPKGNNASEIGGKLRRMDIIGSYDTKRSFVILPYGIYFMSRSGAVKI